MFPDFSEFLKRIAKGAGAKGARQKLSKIVQKCQDRFRHVSTVLAQEKNVKNPQKVSEIISTPNFLAPFGGL